jgi:DNA repair protein RecO (recombination protein O)
VSQERSEAVVIRSVDFSETSRIVTFLTPDRGKLACLAAGVKRPKSKWASLLDTFSRLEIVYYWKEGRSVQKLGDAAPLDTYSGVKADLAKSVYASFPLEFVYKVAQENEPSRELFAALVVGLEGMAAWQGPAAHHAAWQIMRLLAAAGFEPSLEPSPGGGNARFSFDSGTVERNVRAEQTITAAELAALRAMAASRDRCPPCETEGTVFKVLCGYVARQVDSEFRSLRVIDQMFGPVGRPAPA